MRRSSWASWLGMGMLVAAAKANDGDGGPRASRERARERGRGRMRCPRGRGGDVELAHVSWPRRRQAADAVASSCSPASPLCLRGDGEAAGWHGPAQCWACQVGRPGKWPR